MGKNNRRRRVDARRQATESDRQLERTLGLVLRDRLWVHGWQPEELVRQVRRAGGASEADVVAMAVAADTAHHDRAGNVIHESWRRQVDRIVAQFHHEPGRDGWLARWLDTVGRDVGLTTLQALLERLLSLPGLPRLIGPPGSTGNAEVAAGLLEVASSPKLVTIRALLAKAESTEFPAEAEVFTAKAQAMMTGARLDEASVRAGSDQRATGQVSATRIAIDEPYVASKRSLLHVVAEANDVRCVFHRAVDLATLVGPVGQLAHVELLFTSLLIQVQSALTTAAADAPAGSPTRSRRYRSSFIVGFAGRIGERLREARDSSFAGATADVLPVLAADDRATAVVFERVVGRTTRFRSSSTFDAVGIRAGASAADRAALRDTGLSEAATPSLAHRSPIPSRSWRPVTDSRS